MWRMTYRLMDRTDLETKGIGSFGMLSLPTGLMRLGERMEQHLLRGLLAEAEGGEGRRLLLVVALDQAPSQTGSGPVLPQEVSGDRVTQD